MKKFILTTAALVMAATAVEARDIPAGAIMITGDTNLEIGGSETKFPGGTTTTDTAEINLAGLYFVTRNVGLGLMLGSEDTETDDGSSVTNESLTMFGPIVGYNVSLNSDVSLLFHASVFTVTGDLGDDAGLNVDIDGDGYLLGGAVNYFVNDHVAVNFGLRMTKADLDFSDGGTTTAADLDETAASIGLSAFF